MKNVYDDCHITKQIYYFYFIIVYCENILPILIKLDKYKFFNLDKIGLIQFRRSN